MFAARLALLLIASSIAQAAVPQEARDRNEVAKKLFAEGKYAAAAAEWTRVHELTGRPELLFNLGQCYRNAGDADAALAMFRRYLAEKPDAENRADVEQQVVSLESRKARPTARKGPEPSVGPAATAAATTTTGTARSTSPEPLWKRPWVWAVAGAIVAGGVAVAVLATRSSDETPDLASSGPGGSLGWTTARW